MAQSLKQYIFANTSDIAANAFFQLHRTNLEVSSIVWRNLLVMKGNMLWELRDPSVQSSMLRFSGQLALTLDFGQM